MAYTVGASHVLAGSGVVAVTRPAGLRIALSSIPTFIGSSGSHPPELWRVGRLTLGNADGWLPPIQLHAAAQLEYAIPDVGPTLLGYDLVAGLSATVEELVAVPIKGSPWDRNAAGWQNYTSITANGPTSPAVVAWTYTVPVGKILQLDAVRVAKVRTVVATTATATQAFVSIDGAALIGAAEPPNTLNARTEAQAGGTVTLLAGAVVQGRYRNSDTGGSVAIELFAHGILFDA